MYVCNLKALHDAAGMLVVLVQMGGGNQYI